MMDDVLTALTTVWTVPTLVVAALGGLFLGLLVLGHIAQTPSYASDASPLEVAVAIAVSSILAAAVFYAGQAASDPLEDVSARLFSRFGVWCVYSLGMGVGAYVRLSIGNRLHRRKVRARGRAAAETAIHEHDEATLPPRVPKV
jgi:hypothetical protein